MANDITLRSRAARKAARTRAANKASWKRYQEIDRPASLRETALLNRLLTHEPLSVRWNPVPGWNRKLKNGAEYGTIVRFVAPRIWRVLIEGYKRPQDFHASCWELIGE